MSMDIDNDQIEIIQEFVTESRDMIEQLEPAIIELGQNSDPETINAIFRLFHSMKGSAGFLEFDHITRVAHAAENLLDMIRNVGRIHLLGDHLVEEIEHAPLRLEATEEEEAHHLRARVGAKDLCELSGIDERKIRIGDHQPGDLGERHLQGRRAILGKVHAVLCRHARLGDPLGPLLVPIRDQDSLRQLRSPSLKP